MKLQSPLTAIATAFLLFGASCSPSSRVATRVRSDAGTPVHPISAAFTNAWSGYPTWAATDDYAVGFASQDVDSPDRPARLGRMSLADGSIEPLTLPKLSGGVFVPLSILGGRDRAILIGVACDRVPSEFHPLCIPGRLSVWSIDPGNDSLKSVDVDSSLRNLRIQDVEQSQRVGGGWKVVFGTLGATHDEVAKVAVATINGSAVELIRSGLPRANSYCTTSQDIYLLSTNSGASVESNGDVTFVKGDLTNGKETRLPLPELNVSYGAVTVQIGCSGTQLFITSAGSSPKEPSAPHLSVFDGAKWTSLPQLVPNEVVAASSIISDEKGAVFIWTNAKGLPAKVTASGSGPKGNSPILTSGGIMSWRGDSTELLVGQTGDKVPDANGTLSTQSDGKIVVWTK